MESNNPWCLRGWLASFHWNDRSCTLPQFSKDDRRVLDNAVKRHANTCLLTLLLLMRSHSHLFVSYGSSRPRPVPRKVYASTRSCRANRTSPLWDVRGPSQAKRRSAITTNRTVFCIVSSLPSALGTFSVVWPRCQ